MENLVVSFSSFGLCVLTFNSMWITFFYRLGLPAIVPWGQWWCPILPKNQVDLHVVVGAPLALPTIPQPTQNDIDTWHGLYVKQLISLFDTHKGRFGISEDLEVWWYRDTEAPLPLQHYSTGTIKANKIYTGNCTPGVAKLKYTLWSHIHESIFKIYNL